MITTTPVVFERQGHAASLTINHLIARSKFSIYHAEAPAHKTQYAVKAFSKDSASLQQYRREKSFLQAVAHQNIIGYVADTHLDCQEASYNALVLEYAPYGDFLEVIISGKLTDERLIRTYFHQLIDGLEHLHAQEIAHLDLKLENLLIGRDYMLKITDFDQAQKLNNGSYTSKGTKGYRAPEVLSQTYTNVFAADVFSAGMTLYAMVTKKIIFDEKEEDGKKVLADKEGFYHNVGNFWGKVASQTKISILKNDDFCTLITGMLAKDPEHRWTLAQVKDSKWYKGRVYDKKDFESKMKRMVSRK